MAKRWISETDGGVDALRLVDFHVNPPTSGEVTISVRASGVNPVDYKSLSWGGGFPILVGQEIAGVVSAIGANTRIASGEVALGDEVLAFRVRGGYATDVTVPAQDVYLKPPALGFPEAANLLLVGTTAAEMLHLTRVQAGETILVHGAAGSVGVSVLQQARLLGARVVGTASESNWDAVRRFGGIPVSYGPGLEQRVQEAAPERIHAALDCVGTDEAIDVSLALVSPQRIVTTTAQSRASAEGFFSIGGTAQSVNYRNEVRAHLIELARTGELVVPLWKTLPLEKAVEALRLLESGRAAGKLALLSTGT